MLSRRQLHSRLLNRGLTNDELHRAVKNPEGARCPMCDRKLHANLADMAFAGCACCGVEYAIGTDETVYSRYEPNGVPHCKHYA